MPDDVCVLAVDQGTSSTKAVVIDPMGDVRRTASVPLSASSPAPGWVEQDPEEILTGVRHVLATLVAGGDETPVAVGLSNQRESAVAWDAVTGEALSPLLGWQDRRTADRARRLADEGVAELVRQRSGLPLDPMFSALKFAWILDEIDPDRRRARNGQIRLGTVDSWLVDRLTGRWTIETGNASRTQLLNLATGGWDPQLLDVFSIPAQALPPVVRSDQHSPSIGALSHAAASQVCITGILGDSHAALFGHGVREPGMVKVTYGTGSSIMGLAPGDIPPDSGMVSTIGWRTAKTARAFEGNILSTGATILWLSRLLGSDPAELAAEAAGCALPANVSFVPAFAGLGAPYWDESATAVISGFDLGTTRAALARAAFESIPHQIEDVLTAADQVVGSPITDILADGGPTSNDWLMQRQADLSGRVVHRADNPMLSVAGAAHLAGLSVGLWDAEQVAHLPRARTTFTPTTDDRVRHERRERWAREVARARFAAADTQETSPSVGEVHERS